MRKFILGLAIGSFLTYSIPILKQYHDLRTDVNSRLNNIDNKLDSYIRSVSKQLSSQGFMIGRNIMDIGSLEEQVEGINKQLDTIRVNKSIKITIKEEQE